MLYREIESKIKEHSSSLEQIDNEVKKPITLNKCDEEMLGAIQNKIGETTFNLLSIPRDESVTPLKTTFFDIKDYKNKWNESDSNFIKGKILKYSNGEELWSENVNYSTSGYIDCSKFRGKYIVFSGLTINTGYREKIGVLGCYYDDSLKVVGGYSSTQREAIVPTNASFVRISSITYGTNRAYQLEFNSENNYTAYEDFKETEEKIKDKFLPENKVEKEIEIIKTNAQITFDNFLKKSCYTPTFTWIDDDTDINAIEKVKSLCDELGIKATFGCMTTNFYSSNGQTLINKLLNYQNEGFHITTHSKTHGRIWNTSAVEYDLKACELDLVESLKDLQKNNFLHSDYFVIPYGSNNAELQKLSQKWCKATILAHQNANNHLYGNGRYSINRIFIRDNIGTLEYYKNKIDEAFNNGDWIIFGTHSAMSEWNEELVRNVLSYAISKGIECMTLHQAMQKRKFIYDIYEMCK